VNADTAASTTERAQQAKTALGLGLAGLVAMIVLGALEVDGPIWLIVGALALAAIFTGLRTRAGGELSRLALGAVTLGALLFIAFVVGTVIEFA